MCGIKPTVVAVREVLSESKGNSRLKLDKVVSL